MITSRSYKCAGVDVSGSSCCWDSKMLSSLKGLRSSSSKGPDSTTWPHFPRTTTLVQFLIVESLWAIEIVVRPL